MEKKLKDREIVYDWYNAYFRVEYRFQGFDAGNDNAPTNVADDQTRIRLDLINYRYRKNDYNTSTQLNVSDYSTMYAVV